MVVGRVYLKITIIRVNNDKKIITIIITVIITMTIIKMIKIIIIIIIIILTLDHNKYNDGTNHRQELFVFEARPTAIENS